MACAPNTYSASAIAALPAQPAVLPNHSLKPTPTSSWPTRLRAMALCSMNSPMNSRLNSRPGTVRSSPSAAAMHSAPAVTAMPGVFHSSSNNAAKKPNSSAAAIHADTPISPARYQGRPSRCEGTSPETAPAARSRDQSDSAAGDAGRFMRPPPGDPSAAATTRPRSPRPAPRRRAAAIARRVRRGARRHTGSSAGTARPC